MESSSYCFYQCGNESKSDCSVKQKRRGYFEGDLLNHVIIIDTYVIHEMIDNKLKTDNLILLLCVYSQTF